MEWNRVKSILSPANPFTEGSTSLDALVLAAALSIASLFSAYLVRCYLQEFWRKRRVQRRKQLSRAKCNPHAFEPFAATGPKPAQTQDTTEEPVPMIVGKLDCWRLQWVIPTHEQITLVWDTRSPEAMPSTELYIPRNQADKTSESFNEQALLP